MPRQRCGSAGPEIPSCGRRDALSTGQPPLKQAGFVEGTLTQCGPQQAVDSLEGLGTASRVLSSPSNSRRGQCEQIPVRAETRNPVAMGKDTSLELRRGLPTVCSTFWGHLTCILDAGSAREAEGEVVCLSGEVCVRTALWQTDGQVREHQRSPKRGATRQAGQEQEVHGCSSPWTDTKQL